MMIIYHLNKYLGNKFTMAQLIISLSSAQTVELVQIAVLNQMVEENSVVITEQIIKIAVQMEEMVF